MATAKKNALMLNSSRTAFVAACKFLSAPIFVQGNLLQCSLRHSISSHLIKNWLQNSQQMGKLSTEALRIIKMYGGGGEWKEGQKVTGFLQGSGNRKMVKITKNWHWWWKPVPRCSSPQPCTKLYRLPAEHWVGAAETHQSQPGFCPSGKSWKGEVV